MVAKGSIQEETFYSEALQEDMQLLIYIPSNFTPLYKYSVLIASDGKDYFQLGRMARLMDELLEYSEIENTIVVGVPYKNVEDRRRKYHPAGDQHEAYLRFLAHELVPYIDENYPTYHIGMGRALIGDSLAATVSLLATIKYPNIFGKAILQSPMVNDAVIEAVNESRTLPTTSIYHVIGKGETEVKTTNGKVEDFLTPNRELHEVLLDKGGHYFYEEFDGDHTWTYWQPDLKRALLLNFGE